MSRRKHNRPKTYYEKSNYTVKVDSFAGTILNLLKEYGDKAQFVANETVSEVAKEAASSVRRKQYAERYNGTNYAHSWTSKTVEDRLSTVGIAYAKDPYYRLSHLLENGHIDWRTGKRVGQRVHIKPVNNWAIKEVYERTVMKLEGIW